MSPLRRSRLAALVLVPILSCFQAAHAQSSSGVAARAPSAHGDPTLPTLWIVGNGDGRDAAGQREGVRWVGALGPLLDTARIQIADRTDARSSTRGYIVAGQWSDVVSAIKPGDFILIQFAQRSATPDGADNQLASLPGVSDDMREGEDPIHHRREIVHTYGWYLRQYAVEAIARGATPILCSPVANTVAFSEASNDVAWSRGIAVQQRIPFLDLPAAMAAPSAPRMSAGTGDAPAGGAPSVLGPDAVADAVVAGLKGLTGDPLSGYFSAKGNAIPPYRPAPPPPSQP